MHFAVPSQSARISQFKPAPSRPLLRNNHKRLAVYTAGALFLFWALWSIIFGGGSQKPEVVIVTLTDKANYSQEYIQKVVDNRNEYARIHGYEVRSADVSDYWTGTTYGPWARIPIMRHMFKLFPRAGWYWYLDQNCLIMNMQTPLTSILEPKTLDSILYREHPVVLTSNIIKTYKSTKAKNVHFVVTQDRNGFSLDSFVLRNDPWGKYLLDSWFDPVFRFYYNWKANKLTSSLEHIVQWHPTILAKIAIIPQRKINAEPSLAETTEASYREGDLIVNLNGCNEKDSGRNCETELERFMAKRVQRKR